MYAYKISMPDRGQWDPGLEDIGGFTRLSVETTAEFKGRHRLR